MKKNKPLKYLLIWDRLGDYHRARWKALQELIGEENVHAADLGSSDKLYLWQNTDQYRFHYALSNKPVHKHDIWSRAMKYISVTRKNQIDVVAVAGYGRPEYILFIVLGQLMGLKIILFAESWYPGNMFLDKLKGIFLRSFVHGLFVSGVRAEKHFTRRLGIPLHKIAKGYSVVDNDHFSNLRESNIELDGTHNRKAQNTTKQLTTQRLNLPRRLPAGEAGQAGDSTTPQLNPISLQPYLLSVARYSPEKNLPFLIESYRKSSLFRKWKLVLIGDGPQKERLKQTIGKDDDHILLTGWKAYDELPRWYQYAEALILPSTFEPWGLVVNEALASGIDVLASDACGCVDDLMPDDGNRVFKPNDVNSLVKLMELLENTNRMERKMIGMKDDFSCRNWADKMVKLSR